MAEGRVLGSGWSISLMNSITLSANSTLFRDSARTGSEWRKVNSTFQIVCYQLLVRRIFEGVDSGDHHEENYLPKPNSLRQDCKHLLCSCSPCLAKPRGRHIRESHTSRREVWSLFRRLQIPGQSSLDECTDLSCGRLYSLVWGLCGWWSGFRGMLEP